MRKYEKYRALFLANSFLANQRKSTCNIPDCGVKWVYKWRKAVGCGGKWQIQDKKVGIPKRSRPQWQLHFKVVIDDVYR